MTYQIIETKVISVLVWSVTLIQLGHGLCLMFPIAAGTTDFHFLQFPFYSILMTLGFPSNSFLSGVYVIQLSELQSSHKMLVLCLCVGKVLGMRNVLYSFD